jgi:chromosome segregation ATPase
VDPKALEIAERLAGPHTLVSCDWTLAVPVGSFPCNCDRARRVQESSRAITALLREREGFAAQERQVADAQIKRAEEAEAKLRERDEEIAHQKGRAEGFRTLSIAAEEEIGRLKARIKKWEDEESHEAMQCYQNEERAKSAEAALAKKDEALRRIVAGCRLNAPGSSMLPEIARIAKEALDGK